MNQLRWEAEEQSMNEEMERRDAEHLTQWRVTSGEQAAHDAVRDEHNYANLWDNGTDAPLEDHTYWAAWMDLAMVPRLLGTRSTGVSRSSFGHGNW